MPDEDTVSWSASLTRRTVHPWRGQARPGLGFGKVIRWGRVLVSSRPQESSSSIAAPDLYQYQHFLPKSPLFFFESRCSSLLFGLLRALVMSSFSLSLVSNCSDGGALV